MSWTAPSWTRKPDVLIAACVGMAIGVVAWWLLELLTVLTHPDYEQLSRVDRFGAAASLSTTMLMLVIVSLVCSLAVAVNSYLDQRSLLQAETRLARTTQMLTSPEVIGRAGGMWSLQRIMEDTPRLRSDVLATVTAHLRAASVAPTPRDRPSHSGLALDIEAALQVLRDRGHPGRRAKADRRLDLRELNFGRNLDLSRMDLRGADLRRAVLAEADLSATDLTGADLRWANLTEVDLRTTDLTDADLTDAHLTDADLRGKNLTGVELRGADLRRADLRGADLSTAVGIRHDSVEAVTIDDATKLPPHLADRVRR